MRIALSTWKRQNGIETEEQMTKILIDATLDSVVPAMCDEGCEVEPDGYCPHDAPSLLIRLGLI